MRTELCCDDLHQHGPSPLSGRVRPGICMHFLCRQHRADCAHRGRPAHLIITQESFLELFQLSIDKDKTYAWALQPKDRRALQSLHHRVSVQERDLGGLMTYGKRRRTSFHDQIIAGVRPCWQQLRNSNMHGHNKILVVYQALWPRIFHSACISDLGTAHIQQLRSAAVKALGHGKAGANQGIRTTTLLDPAFYQLYCSSRLSQSRD